jgi:hypothetical protein
VADLLAYSPEQQRALEEEVARIAAGRYPGPAGHFDDVIDATAEFLLGRLAGP